MANVIGDAYLVYNLVKKLTTPFTKWPAYKMGIIDAHGNVLRHKKDLKDSEENNAWGYFDIAVANLKKLIAKMPGGSTRIANFAAAAFLFREDVEYDFEDQSEVELFESRFNEYMNLIEDAPVNAVGGGHIAGVGIGPQGEPPMGKKALLRHVKSVLKRKRPQ